MEQERKEDTLARVPLAHGENIYSYTKRGNPPETGGWKRQNVVGKTISEVKFQSHINVNLLYFACNATKYKSVSC